ncbi:circadian clock-controlled protein-like [Photinus pyralis]|uniref:Haemolymph juvenile hormone binding protein n=1 Tax=Photinus pyralis TaxID=7054 RepID=A0A1Y1NAE1_PHOPY|nr:circadian clock-controlled protein-like [Photinus pyralis]
MDDLNKFVLAVLLVVPVAHCAIPSYIKVCPRSHQNLSACITNSIEALKPYLAKGIPKLDVPGLEPLDLETIVIDSLGSGTRLATNISNLEVYGASDFTILKLTPTMTKKGYNFRFQVNVPRLRVSGMYELDSRILFLDLKGQGPFHANISDYHFECIMKGHQVRREERNYLEFEDMKCTLVVGGVSVRLENLFESNPTLAKATNDVINDNVQVLFDEIKPGLLKALTRRFTEIANKITLAFTYEELFP